MIEKGYSLKAVPTATVRRRTVGSCRAGSPGTRAAVGICGEPAIHALWRLVGVGTADAHHVLVFGEAVATAVAGAGEGGDDGGEFALEDDDALLDDHVRVEVADAFDVDVEVIWLSVVVEGLVGGRGVFPRGVCGDGPE